MSSNYKPASKTYWPLEEMTDLKIGFWTFNDVYSLSFYIYFTECFHSRGQHLCKFIRTKESVCIRKEFNSHRICLGHQHGRRFIVMAAVTSCENTLYFECVHTSKRTLIQAERSFHFNKWCHDLGLYSMGFACFGWWAPGLQHAPHSSAEFLYIILHCSLKSDMILPASTVFQALVFLINFAALIISYSKGPLFDISKNKVINLVPGIFLENGVPPGTEIGFSIIQTTFK